MSGQVFRGQARGRAGCRTICAVVGRGSRCDARESGCSIEGRRSRADLLDGKRVLICWRTPSSRRSKSSAVSPLTRRPGLVTHDDVDEDEIDAAAKQWDTVGRAAAPPVSAREPQSPHRC